METSAPSAADSPARKSRSWRWIMLLIASGLLHLIAFNWADGRIGLPSLRDQSPTVIAAALRSAAPSVAPAAPLKPRTKPRAKPHAKPRAASAAPPPAPEPVAADAAPSLPPAGMEVPGTSVAPATEVAATQAPPADADVVPAASAEGAVKAEEPAARYKVSPPPSAELKYDVQALREGQTVYGSGMISWQSDGSGYTVTGEAGILFFTVLSFKSEGMIDDSGVAPVLYSEKRFRKPQTNTHFHRERNTISFSASTVAYPRKGGEQDRASVVWQLVGIGRGDSEKFVPDAELDIFVAGVRDGETWRIRVIGMEDIDAGNGRISAWHVVRMPRPGSYDQKIDIWLAPQQEWYPVKLRYTETNGDFLDMLLSNVHFAKAR